MYTPTLHGQVATVSMRVKYMPFSLVRIIPIQRVVCLYILSSDAV
jgi:hypothetical protein